MKGALKGSRITAVGLVAAAALWIVSGYLFPHDTSHGNAAPRPSEAAAQKKFRVSVVDTAVQPHSRKLVLSGRTEADKKVVIFARTNGLLEDLRVRRGSRVKKGEVMAILKVEDREALVMQAKAMLAQKRIELEAKRRLLLSNAVPKLELDNLEAQFKVAEAAVATAEAELGRSIIVAPWDGIVTEVSEVGTAAFSFTGKEIVKMVGLDPVLALVEVSERNAARVKVGTTAEIRLANGLTRQGRIRYVSPSASESTRTYRVEIQMDNPDYLIPDGITAEATIPLEPTPATRVPRSALVFASSGELGVRTVGEGDKVGFVPVSIVEDEQSNMWLAGVPDGTRVIVQGQDFVREGNVVEAVSATAAQSAQR
ncbi:MAG: efflux RND transporter periplasmic adaptor subunit [Xanthobacteraceae bacterium]|nr:efflux RND transporter periplasmic adaptor subunit [Xanthobacteraceae bacterium]